MTGQAGLLTKEQLAKVMEGICPKCKGEVQTVVKREAYSCTPCRTLYEIRKYMQGDEGPIK